MRFEFIVFAFLVSAAITNASPSPDSSSYERDRYKKYGDDDTPYKFWYKVGEVDPYGKKVYFGHHEEKDDDGKVTGHYYVDLPDRRRQRVDYKVEDYSGFVANVTYEGTAVFPDKGSYKKKDSKEDSKEKKDIYGKDSKEKKDSYKY